MQNIHDEDIEIIEDFAEFPWTGQFDHRDIHQQIYNETQGVHVDHLHPNMPHPNMSNYTNSTMGLMAVDSSITDIK
jgi:hypothetical protein